MTVTTPRTAISRMILVSLVLPPNSRMLAIPPRKKMTRVKMAKNKSGVGLKFSTLGMTASWAVIVKKTQEQNDNQRRERTWFVHAVLSPPDQPQKPPPFLNSASSDSAAPI